MSSRSKDTALRGEKDSRACLAGRDQPVEAPHETRDANPWCPKTLSRRHVLKVMSSMPVASLVPLLPGLHEPATEATQTGAAVPAQSGTVPATTTYQPKVLDAHEWKTIRVLSDLIIPVDERSGSATQAGVPEYIDDWLEFKGGVLLDQIRGGLTWLDMECERQFSRDFVDCTEAQQKRLLDRIAYPKTAAPEDQPGVAFFNRLRDLVVSGFFSSETGVRDLPYLGNQMLAEWNGCSPQAVARLGLKKC